jgi:hypothetical protein
MIQELFNDDVSNVQDIWRRFIIRLLNNVVSTETLVFSDGTEETHKSLSKNRQSSSTDSNP